jgi:hypothetical protein
MEPQAAQQRYLIYSKGDYGNHAVVHLVEAPTPTEALWRYIWSALGPDIIRHPDGSLEDDGILYPHPLAYIEAGFKRYGEWQMRLLLEPTPEEPCRENFCGESEDGTAEVIAECRRQGGKKRAKAFVWYVRAGTLVTFYRKSKPYRIKVLARYLCNYEGGESTVKKWKGDYPELMDALYLLPY